MSSALPPCPDCGSSNIVKNGTIHTGKQNHKCKECWRQFVEEPQNKIIDEATKHLIDNLLLEKIPLAGIARVAEVSEVWLQQYVNAKYAQVERQVQVRAQKKGPCRSRKSSKNTLARSSPSSTTTTHPYLFRTTVVYLSTFSNISKALSLLNNQQSKFA